MSSGPEDGERRPRRVSSVGIRRAVVTAAGVLAYLGLHLAPLPGAAPGLPWPSNLDSGAGALLVLLGLDPPGSSLVALGLAPLVAVRWGLALAFDPAASRRPRLAHAAGLAVYLVLCAAWVVTLRAGVEPLTLSALVLGAALLWGLAALIDAFGRGRGVLILVLASGSVAIGHQLVQAGQHLYAASLSPLAAWGDVALALPPALVLLAWWRWPTALPRRVCRGWGAESVLDVVAAPLVPIVVLAEVAGWTARSWPPAAPLVAAAVVAVFAAWQLRRWHRAARRERTPRPLGVALGAPALAVFLVWAGRSSAALAPFAPAPFDGTGRFDVTLACDDGFTDPNDAWVMLARLRELRVDAELRRLDTERFELRLARVDDAAEAMAAVLPRGRFALAFVAEDQRPFGDDVHFSPCSGFDRVSSRDELETPYEAATSEAMHGRVADAVALPPNRSVAALCRVVRDTEDRVFRTCRPWLLEHPIVTERDIAAIRLRHDPWPRVALELEAAGAQRVFAATQRESHGRYLAVVMDGEITDAPAISEAIPDGRVALERSWGRSAPAFVAQLAHGVLQRRYRVERIVPAP